VGSNYSWYWTTERLSELRRIIETATQRDDKGYYIGPIGLSRYIIANGARLGFDVPHSQVPNGLAILVHLRVLDASRPGRVGRGERRRYYRDRIIDDDDVLRYRQWKRENRA